MVKIEDINLCDLEQFTSGCPEAAFKTIRQEAPVWFHPATEQAPDHEGFWVISRHADAKAALKNHQVFSSETGYGARVGGGTTLGDMSTDMAPGVVLAIVAVFVFAGCRLVNELHPAFCPPAGGH